MRKIGCVRIACYQVKFSAHGEVNGEVLYTGISFGGPGCQGDVVRGSPILLGLAPERGKTNAIFLRQIGLWGRMTSKISWVRIACYRVQLSAHGEVNGELLCTGISFGGPGCQSGVVGGSRILFRLAPERGKTNPIFLRQIGLWE